MMNEKCMCLEMKVTEKEKLYIGLSVLYADILLEMFPKSKVMDAIPNIWYKAVEKGIIFFSDLDEICAVECENIFDIMFVIEDYVQLKQKKLTLHGGAIAYENKAIVFIQSRKSGKSTLIRALLNKYEYEYISDDILFYDDKCVAGLAMPIRVRDKLDNIVGEMGKYVGEMLDEDGEVRNIYVPQNTIRVGFTKIVAMVLPRYVSEEINQINELKGSYKVMKILTNIKEYHSMENLFYELVEMVRGIHVYELLYHDIVYARREIKKLWSS